MGLLSSNFLGRIYSRFHRIESPSYQMSNGSQHLIFPFLCLLSYTHQTSRISRYVSWKSWIQRLRPLLLLWLDRLLYPSPGVIDFSRIFETFPQHSSKRKCMIISCFFPTSWLMGLSRVMGSFRLTIKTGANMTSPWHIALSLYLLCVVGADNKGITFGCY